MSRPLKPSESILKDVLPELEEPILFQNMLKNSNGSFEWKLLQWSLKELAEKFGDKKLPFRVGDHNKRACALQREHWKINSPASLPPSLIHFLTLQEFVKEHKTKKDDMWYYCDYRHIKDWLDNNTEIVESFNWLKFGIDKEFGENGMYSTIWIGSEGAHTDCHWDTYGYNLVAQVHGRKQWLLYPPSAPLVPVRLPYEESTVYSRYNIYCLNDEEKDYLLELKSDKPKLITLEPGDVLFVPNGWWHYVESLDQINVSVNIWGELKTDSTAQVEEALVKLIIAKMGDYRQFPNKETIHYTEEVEKAVICEEKKREKKEESTPKIPAKRSRPKPQTATELAEEYPYYVKLLPDAEEHEYEEFIEERWKRDKKINPPKKSTKESTEESSEESTEENTSTDRIPGPQYESFFESIINALCHPEVISKAAKVLLERHY